MFVHVITGRTSDPKAVRRSVDAWARDFRPQVTGFLGATCGVSRDGRFVEVACFASEESANAIRYTPELEAWKAEIDKSLKDIRFHDATEVFTMLGGANAAAGFVQVMRGRVTDPEKLASITAELDGLEEVLSRARPDVLGEILVLHADGTFTETVYFTSEEAARAHEAASMPPDAQAMLDELTGAVEVDEYIDLSQPWPVS